MTEEYVKFETSLELILGINLKKSLVAKKRTPHAF